MSITDRSLGFIPSFFASAAAVMVFGFLFISFSITSAAPPPSTIPPNSNPIYNLYGPAGPQGPSGPPGPAGPAGPEGPQGPAASRRLPSQIIKVNQGSNTTVWRCAVANVQNECGDSDGCDIKFIMSHKTDSNNHVRTIDEHIFMESIGYGFNSANGIYGWTRQGGGGDYSWISGAGNYTIADPWQWAWMFTYEHSNCYGKTTTLPAYSFGFMSHPQVETWFLVYD